MHIFALKKMDEVNGKQVFYQLCVDGIPQLEMYETEMEDKYLSQFRQLLTMMDLVANLVSLPDTKFKDVTPQQDPVKEYEFKTRDLRVLAIQTAGGKIIILGGYKNTQKADFRRFRSLKQQYLQSI